MLMMRVEKGLVVGISSLSLRILDHSNRYVLGFFVIYFYFLYVFFVLSDIFIYLKGL